jgi:hypothetical protein
LRIAVVEQGPPDVVPGWSELVSRVVRLYPAHSVREMGPRTRSLGASSGLEQPKTLSLYGFWNDVTTAPAPSVKFIVSPATRP